MYLHFFQSRTQLIFNNVEKRKRVKFNDFILELSYNSDITFPLFWYYLQTSVVIFSHLSNDKYFFLFTSILL